MKGLLAILLIYCFSLPISLAKPIDVIIYSATAWYRHPEIPRLNGFLVRLGAKHNINVSVTENPNDLKSENLKKYNLLLFNNYTNLGESIPREIQKEIIQKLEEERKVIEGNKKLIEVYTQKIQNRINKVWGE